MPSMVDAVVRAARQAATAGDWEAAERLWQEVRSVEPGHPQALLSLGIHSLRRGDIAQGYQLLCAARAASPSDRLVLLTLSAACRERRDAAGEREAIDAALTVDPYFLPALLAKAGWIERHGSAAGAAATYANALKIAPPQTHWPTELRPQLEHACEAVGRHSKAFSAYLAEKLADLQAKLPPPVAERWREAVSIMVGYSKPFLADCNQLHLPRLPAIPFFDRAQFPWLAALEAKTDIIRGELAAALDADRDRFTPYIAYNPGEPVNQWRDLNHSPRWSALHLWRGGAPVQENLDRCPQTAEALAAMPMADIGGLCPNALFSVLAPKTHIPPHHGETNARLVAHLPLVVPNGCRFRVGFEERRWSIGEVLVFDDTIEHEAYNDSDEPRVVLIFDLWNPLLASAERQMVRATTAAAREFRG
ncbi:MAG: aspartyl/asparaginyl beta-hydroxylase domain-containing protein [Steroidobacteraceae bacterium]